MSMTDPIADFCTRIRNGYAAKKRWVDVPSSTLKKRLSLVLKEEGYIDNFVFVDKEDSKEDIRLYLRYNENSPATALDLLEHHCTVFFYKSDNDSINDKVG